MLLLPCTQYGSFVGPKTVRVEGVDYTADHILVAVGGKPTMPPVEGVEHCISSNGFFELEVCGVKYYWLVLRLISGRTAVRMRCRAYNPGPSRISAVARIAPEYIPHHTRNTSPNVECLYATPFSKTTSGGFGPFPFVHPSNSVARVITVLSFSAVVQSW